MFREDTWSKGFYIDNHDKYLCLECGNSFIIGRKLMEMAGRNLPICPYCGSNYIESTVSKPYRKAGIIEEFIYEAFLYLDQYRREKGEISLKKASDLFTTRSWRAVVKESKFNLGVYYVEKRENSHRLLFRR